MQAKQDMFQLQKITLGKSQDVYILQSSKYSELVILIGSHSCISPGGVLIASFGFYLQF